MARLTMASDPNAPTPAMPAASVSRVSPWATASFLCSVAICCPPMTIMSVLLGIRALVQTNADPSMRGRGLAKIGITIGLLATVGWIGTFIWWHFNARQPMLYGPREEMLAGLAGDVAGFKAGFAGPAAVAPDSTAQAFLSELTNRYGGLVNSAQSQTPTHVASMSGPAAFPISYTFQFQRQTVEGEATFITFAQTHYLPRLIFKWESIKIIDPDRGDLVYP